MAANRRLREAALHLQVRSSVVAVASAAELLPDAGKRRPALSGGKQPQRVPVSDQEAVAAALRVDGVVILTHLPGDDSKQGYWEDIANELPALCFGEDGLIPGTPPVSAVHHEFARSGQIRQLQAQQGKVGGVINALNADELLEAAEAQGMPHFTTVPWKEMGNANPHTDGCKLQMLEPFLVTVYASHTSVLRQARAAGRQMFTVITSPTTFSCSWKHRTTSAASHTSLMAKRCSSACAQTRTRKLCCRCSERSCLTKQKAKPTAVSSKGGRAPAQYFQGVMMGGCNGSEC